MIIRSNNANDVGSMPNTLTNPMSTQAFRASPTAAEHGISSTTTSAISKSTEKTGALANAANRASSTVADISTMRANLDAQLTQIAPSSTSATIITEISADLDEVLKDSDSLSGIDESAIESAWKIFNEKTKTTNVNGKKTLSSGEEYQFVQITEAEFKRYMTALVGEYAKIKAYIDDDERVEHLSMCNLFTDAYSAQLEKCEELEQAANATVAGEETE